MAIILNLCVDTLQQVEGFNNYADFQQGMTQINGVIAHGRQQVADRCQRFAQKYQDEKLFYILSSGAFLWPCLWFCYLLTNGNAMATCRTYSLR